MSVSIYTLAEKGSLPFYVGATTNTKRREQDHRRKWPSASPTVIEVVDDANWRVKEQYWITHFQTVSELVNTNPGGTGSCSSETRQKLSQRSTGRSAWNKGLNLPPLSERRARISATMKQRWAARKAEKVQVQ